MHKAKLYHAVPAHTGSRSRRNVSAAPYKPEYPRVVPCVTVIKLVKDMFTDTIDYRNYGMIKYLTRYDNYVANELDKMTEKATVQMKYGAFSGKDPCR